MARSSRKVKSFFFCFIFFVNRSTFDRFVGSSASMTPSLLQARIKWTN